MSAQQMRFITPWEGARIRRAREQQGKTREQFAAELHLHAATVQLAERGAKRIRWDVARALLPFMKRRA